MVASADGAGVTLVLPEGVRLTGDITGFEADVLRLQAAASGPYAAFVYDDASQAERINRMLFETGTAEFCAPASSVLVEHGAAAALLVALDDAMLRRRRMLSAKAIMRSGELDSHPDFAARLQQAGTTLHQVVAGDWYLSRIAVSDAARGKGYGRLLLDQFLAVGRERGMQRAVLEVDPHNATAVRLYEAAGFQTMGQHEVADASTTRRLRYRIMARVL